MGQLYKITFKTSGKSYIGISTVSAKYRWRSHTDPTNTFAIGLAFKKYGIEDAELIVLAECNSWKELCKMEIAAIAAHKTMSPTGYNMATGGKGLVGYVYTQEQRAANSARQKKRFSDPAEILAMSERAKKRARTPEAQMAFSLRMSKYFADPANIIAMSERSKAQFSDPLARAAVAAWNKTYWADPATRDAARAKSKDQFASPAALAAMKDRLKKAKNRPEVRAANSARCQAQAKRNMADPLTRIKILSAMAIGHAKKAGRPFSYIPR
jgi:hypothetical protein